jgi:signal transduction histidine kinase
MDLKVDPDFADVVISDNGVGMDEETLERLFDPFYTKKSDGVGLGMTAVQTIVTEHSGEIKIESEPGAGSTFHISLPIHK